MARPESYQCAPTGGPGARPTTVRGRRGVRTARSRGDLSYMGASPRAPRAFVLPAGFGLQRNAVPLREPGARS
ncbi:hypothetical protein GCM10009731_36910 [Streptomyces globosus]